MKHRLNIMILLLAICLLASCTSVPGKEPQIEARYNSASYDLMLPESTSYEIEGNGRNAVIMPFSNNADPGENNVYGGTSLYKMTQNGKSVTGTLFAELEHPAILLGMDRTDGIWLYNGIVQRLSLEGEQTLSIELPYPLWQNGVFGFANDGKYTWLLCWFRDPDESQILAYDSEGTLVYSQELTTYCQGTLGLLPREEEWAEELEGREDDFLLSMLFPDGPQDSVMLTELRNGSVAVALIRKSPIDGECYCILCPIQEDFSIKPVMYYEVDSDSGIPYGLPIASPEDEYDLLSPQKDALYGVDIENGTITPLAGWTALDTGPSWFTGWANSVSLGPDGRIWSLEYVPDQKKEIVRTIGPVDNVE